MISRNPPHHSRPDHPCLNSAPAPPADAPAACLAAGRASGPAAPDLGRLPATVALNTAARILGIGAAAEAHELARRGEFPCHVTTTGGSCRVLFKDLLRSLHRRHQDPERQERLPRAPDPVMHRIDGSVPGPRREGGRR